LVEKSKVNYAFMRKTAGDQVQQSLSSEGYRQQTVSFIVETLSDLISRDIELDAQQAKKINSQLLALLDAETLAHTSPDREGDDEDN
jgi:hypothetical protein